MSQALPLRDQLQALENLQELDLKIDSLKQKKASIPVALKALTDNYAKAKAAVDAKGAAIGEFEKGMRQTQAGIDLNRDRATRANSKLEGVQNSHEFQAANKEVDQLKKLNVSLDEQLKKAETDKQALAKSLLDLNSKAEQAQAALNEQKQVFSADESKVELELSSLLQSRTQFTQRVEKRILAYYDKIRTSKPGGTGISPAVGGRCSACNMVLPPQLFNDVQRGSALQSCASCHRILFIPNKGPEGMTST